MTRMQWASPTTWAQSGFLGMKYIIESPYLRLGCGTLGVEASRFRKDHRNSPEMQNAKDLSTLAGERGVRPPVAGGRLGMQALAQMVLNKGLAKDAGIRMGDWPVGWISYRQS